MRQTVRGAVLIGIALTGVTLWVLFRPRYDYAWKANAPLPSAINSPDREDYEPNFTPDGRSVLFTRGRAGHNADLFIAPWPLRRGSADALRPLTSVNTSFDEIGGMPGRDGWLYFYSDRPGGQGGYDLYAAPRRPDGHYGPARNLGRAVNSVYNDYDPCLSACGRFLFFASNRHSAGSEEDYDLYVSVREGHGPWGPAKRLAAVNSPANEWEPILDRRGRILYFTSNRERTEPDGTVRRDYDLYASVFTRAGWSPPRNLGPRVNTDQDELDPGFSPDGRHFLFVRAVRTASSYDVDIWQGTLEPIALGPLVNPKQWPWHALALMALMAALVGLLAFLFALWRRLNTLQRCLVGSLVAHLVGAWLLSLLYLETRLDHDDAAERSFTLYTDLPETFDAEAFVASLFDPTPQPLSTPAVSPTPPQPLEIPAADAEPLEREWSPQPIQPKMSLAPVAASRAESAPELIPLSSPEAPEEPTPPIPAHHSTPPTLPDPPSRSWTTPKVIEPPAPRPAPAAVGMREPAVSPSLRPLSVKNPSASPPPLTPLSVTESLNTSPTLASADSSPRTPALEPALADARAVAVHLPVAPFATLKSPPTMTAATTSFFPSAARPRRSLAIARPDVGDSPSPTPAPLLLASLSETDSPQAIPHTETSEAPDRHPLTPTVRPPLQSFAIAPPRPPVTPEGTIAHESGEHTSPLAPTPSLPLPHPPPHSTTRAEIAIPDETVVTDQAPIVSVRPPPTLFPRPKGFPAAQDRSPSSTPLAVSGPPVPRLNSPPPEGPPPLRPPAHLPVRGPTTGPTARPARIRWGEVKNVGPILNTDESEYEPNFTLDGRFLVFTRGRAGHNADLYPLPWPPDREPGARPLPLVPVNTDADEIDGSRSADGHLYFYSDRPGGSGGYDLYRAPFQPEGDEFGKAVNLGPLVNSPFNDYDPFVSRDGQRLFFFSNRHCGGSEEDYDLYVAVREADGSWGPPQRLPFNTTANEWEPALSVDGLSLYFSSNRGGGFGGYDLWVSHFREGRWQEPVNLGPDINTSTDELDPAVSEDGTELLFASNRDGGHGRFDVWSARRVLTVAP